ncbi:vacuolar protein sorting-associated protein 2 homolog 2 [Phtheirospermum japonicum]|uniref:Vacuolar protein sorting-associated protein 2 homolog 2 n=1 Tax=Phtheirospermum japonicum TaxID=374723 RepID=A0A830BAX2_9LAMI|nr:vacuolar protein sorting-associated protein 2 homolog 2 [Phtheirospermum japonicum]
MNLNIFKKKTSPKDALRTSKREMAVATRGIEREIASLQMEERRLVAEIKKTAKTGNEATNNELAGQSCPDQRRDNSYTGMKGATKAMSAMNKIEMMSDAIDETLDKDEAEEESEELTNQVLDEIGVDIASQLSSAPKGRIASKKVENVAAPSAAAASNDVEDLEKRLASLRRI